VELVVEIGEIVEDGDEDGRVDGVLVVISVCRMSPGSGAGAGSS